MRKSWMWPLLILALLSAGIGAAIWPRSPKAHPDTGLYTDRQQGLVLAAGLSSYASLEEGVAHLEARHHKVLRQRLARPPDIRYPVHVLDTLTVMDYPLLGTQGRLRLEFFNDRLYEVNFKPDDAAVCLATLRRSDRGLQRDRNGRAERVQAALRVATNVEMASTSVGEALGTEPYVLWQDLRLVRERDDWDERFGALPFASE